MPGDRSSGDSLPCCAPPTVFAIVARLLPGRAFDRLALESSRASWRRLASHHSCSGWLLVGQGRVAALGSGLRRAGQPARG